MNGQGRRRSEAKYCVDGKEGNNERREKTAKMNE